MARPENILMISYDCFREDVSYDGRNASIERLRREGVCFRAAICSAPLTPISHASLFTGLHPARHGLRRLVGSAVSADRPLLAERLAALGFETAAIIAGPGLVHQYGFDRGFAHFDDALHTLPDGSDPFDCPDAKLRGLACRSADEILEAALAFLQTERTRPFFLFVHFFDAHWPYRVPEGFEAGPARHPYETAVRYVDQHAARLLDALDELGLTRQTLVVGFGDHGEDLEGAYPNDHGGEALGHPEEQGHGMLLYDVTLRVPLVMRLPEVLPAGLEIDAQVRLIDVLPTIFDLLGVELTGQQDGESLLPLEAICDRPAHFETLHHMDRSGLYSFTCRGKRGVRIQTPAGAWKVLWDINSDPVEIFDLRQDPNEQNNLLGLWPTPWGAPLGAD